MEEIWKEVKGYEGLYRVSNLGRIKRLKRKDSNGITLKEMIMKNSKHGNEENGYYERVYLSKNGIKKQKFVHRLVAQSFIENPDNRPQVNHIDGNKQNNNVDNLEWMTGSENMKHAINIGLFKPNKSDKARKLSDKQALDVLKRLNEKESTKDIAELYNVTTVTIQNIKNGVGCYSKITQKN